MTHNLLVSPRLRLLQQEIQEKGNLPLSKFWAEIKDRRTPMIEVDAEGYSLVTFLWRDDTIAQSVAVIQDWGSDGIREHQMSRLPGTDVWYLTQRMRSDTRTTYQLSPSSSTNPQEPAPYQLDPLNPKTFTAYLSETGHHILFSLLELPEAPRLPWRETDLVHTSSVQLHTPFADQRRLWVYTPLTPIKDLLPILVVFDGRLYKDQLKLPEMLDYLIAQGQIPPVAALLIDNPDRSELLCREEFADYVASQVMPWICINYPITNDPLLNIVMGSSYGGLASAFLGLRYPNIFGTVLSQTGWFRWHPEEDPEHHWLARQFHAAPKASLRFWLQVGNLEVAQMLDGGPSQLTANRHFRDVLQAREYFVSYHEYSGGHDASSLEYPLSRALVEIFENTTA